MAPDSERVLLGGTSQMSEESRITRPELHSSLLWLRKFGSSRDVVRPLVESAS